MQKHIDNKDERHSSLEKYTFFFIERAVCERELETEQNCNILTPHSIGHNRVSFPFYWPAQPGAWWAASLGHVPQSSLFSPTRLIPNWLNFLCTVLYNCSTSTFFLWASQIALIQPVHGQCYILIFLDRMHLLFIQVHFLFWQLGRVGGQYATLDVSLSTNVLGMAWINLFSPNHKQKVDCDLSLRFTNHSTRRYIWIQTSFRFGFFV